MKFSIITVCWNSQDTIEQTIQSVLNQTFKDFEYIIIDGQSTDNTLAIIDKYKDRITQFISEPDKGIYDAMNKGIDLAQGDYIMFLNADDVLFHENVLALTAQKANIEKYELLYGDLIFLEKENGNFKNRKQDNVNKIYLCGGMLFHPTIFATKKLFEKIGKFDISYKIVADYEWILRALIKNKATCKYLDFTTTIFSHGEGISSNPKNKALNKNERLEVQKKYFNPIEYTLFNFIYKSMRSILKFPILKQILRKQFLKERNQNDL